MSEKLTRDPWESIPIGLGTKTAPVRDLTPDDDGRTLLCRPNFATFGPLGTSSVCHYRGVTKTKDD